MPETRVAHVLHLLALLLVLIAPSHLTAQDAGSPATPASSGLAALPSAPSAQPSPDSTQESSGPCISSTVSQLGSDASRYGKGLRSLPRNMVRQENLKWEIPIAVAAVVLVEGVDSHVSNQVKAGSYNTASDNASNILIGSELGVAALTYGYGCMEHRAHARRAGFAALEAAGYGLGADLVMKALFNREYPDKFNGDGRFWHGGKSFPSAHAATSWAVASALAHQYPHNKWVKWGAYGAATSISVLRLTARKHFPSDVLIGATVGYVTGSYIGARQ
jgi:hypothetical protein